MTESSIASAEHAKEFLLNEERKKRARSADARKRQLEERLAPGTPSMEALLATTYTTPASSSISAKQPTSSSSDRHPMTYPTLGTTLGATTAAPSSSSSALQNKKVEILYYSVVHGTWRVVKDEIGRLVNSLVVLL